VNRSTPPPGRGVAPAACAPQPADAALATVLAQSWALLAQGCADPTHGCHWPVLATVALDGSADARTVVLRAVDAATRVLAVHSDARAGKLAQLRANPQACLVFHDAAARTQLRVSGWVSIHAGDEAAAQAWAALRPQSQALYEGFARFTLLSLRVQALDWLLLDPAGHRRARFRWTTGKGASDEDQHAAPDRHHDATAVEAAWIEP
jgi:pyridoxamine 5'-phosphate oxidase